MIREAPAMTVRQKFGELLNEVQYRRGKVVITKAGKPVAALVDMALFDKIRLLDEEFERMKKDMAKAFNKVSAKQGAALIDEAVRKTRKQKRTRK